MFWIFPDACKYCAVFLEVTVLWIHFIHPIVLHFCVSQLSSLYQCLITSTLSVTSDQQLTIERSESFNYYEKGDYGHYTPDKAHDGNYNTWYSVKDGAVAGNFLKLYLSRAFSIGQVNMTSRRGLHYVMSMVNTEVRVYSTVSGETEVASCGKITGSDRQLSRIRYYISKNRNKILKTQGKPV